jgi:hypothetical protein
MNSNCSIRRAFWQPKRTAVRLENNKVFHFTLKSTLTLMKCDMMSARSLAVLPLNISCTVQKLVWLNRLVNATTLGAFTNLSFFVHSQLDSSSGWMAAKMGKSSRVNWLANSSGVTRSALIMIWSMSWIDAFGGRLCDLLCDEIPFGLKQGKEE